MIQAHGLTKTFGDKTAISDISFHVKQGEIVGFLGPNGAGKTTTMRILSGYFPPSGGSGSVAGCDIFSESLKAREKIGYLPEHPPLYNDMIVRDYLVFVAKLRGVQGETIGERVDETLGLCGIEEVAGRLIGHLSKGYRQRVGLAQALIHQPDVLILDEPTVGLDPKQIIEIRELIKGLKGKTTIILSTHILPEVSQTCDRVIVLHKGKVIATDTIGGLGSSLSKDDRLEVLVRRNDEALAKTIEAIPGVVDLSAAASDASGDSCLVVTTKRGTDVREEVAKAVVTGGFGLLGLARKSLSLEEVFLELTTEEAATSGSPPRPDSEKTATAPEAAAGKGEEAS